MFDRGYSDVRCQCTVGVSVLQSYGDRSVPVLADRSLLHFSLLQAGGVQSVVSLQPGEAYAHSCPKEIFMKRIAEATRVIIVGALCSIAFAPAARAGCGGSSESVPRGLTPPAAVRAGYLPASFALRADDSEDASIVWLCQITFTSRGTPGIPDGTVIDAGYATWHADGTEIMNSGRPPITSSFCMGVWKQVGRSTFRLNHVALSWDTSGMNFVGRASIKEQITVDRIGNGYNGTFTIDQFDTSGNVLAHITGEVTGRRITVN